MQTGLLGVLTDTSLPFMMVLAQMAVTPARGIGLSIAGGAGTGGGATLAVFAPGFAILGLSLVNVPAIVINSLPGVLLVVAIAVPVVAARLTGRAPTRD